MAAITSSAAESDQGALFFVSMGGSGERDPGSRYHPHVPKSIGGEYIDDRLDREYTEHRNLTANLKYAKKRSEECPQCDYESRVRLHGPFGHARPVSVISAPSPPRHHVSNTEVPPPVAPMSITELFASPPPAGYRPMNQPWANEARRYGVPLLFDPTGLCMINVSPKYMGSLVAACIGGWQDDRVSAAHDAASLNFRAFVNRPLGLLIHDPETNSPVGGNPRSSSHKRRRREGGASAVDATACGAADEALGERDEGGYLVLRPGNLEAFVNAVLLQTEKGLPKGIHLQRLERGYAIVRIDVPSVITCRIGKRTMGGHITSSQHAHH